MLQISLKIALKFLLYKVDATLGFVRKTFLLATTGLAISILCLIILDSISNGYKSSLRDKLSSIESHIHIGKYDNQRISQDEFIRLSSILDSIEYIEKYSFEAEQKGMLKDDSYSEGVVVKTVIDGELDELTPFLITKEIFSLKQKETIIGKKLKDRLGINKGSSIVLLNTDFTKNGIIYNNALSAKVVDAFSFGIPKIDNSIVYIHKTDFKKLFGNNDPDNVRIFLKDIEKQGEVLILLESELAEDFYVVTFDDRHEKRLKSLSDIFNSISIIVYFLIAICFFNMASSIWLIIESKDKDIKTLKLAGMSDIYIYIIFLFITSLSVFISFFAGSIFSFIFIGIQNTFQIFQISPDVYIVPELIGILDFKFLGKLLIILIGMSFFLSLVTYIKRLIFIKNKSRNV